MRSCSLVYLEKKTKCLEAISLGQVQQTSVELCSIKKMEVCIGVPYLWETPEIRDPPHCTDSIMICSVEEVAIRIHVNLFNVYIGTYVAKKWDFCAKIGTFNLI